MTDTTIKNLYENYNSSELLQAFLLHEAKFRLNDIHNLDEKTINDNYENIAEIMFDDVEIFNYDHIDQAIDNYFNPKNE